MPATQRIRSVETARDELEDLLEVVRAAGGQQLERRVLAASLRLLATWLTDQAQLLAAADDTSWPQMLRDRVRAPDHEWRAPAAQLTRRELEIAERIARGYSNRQIAADLVITVSTTERHVANILHKLDMRSRAQVAAWVVQRAR